MTAESFFVNRTLSLGELLKKNDPLTDYKIFPSFFQRGYCWPESTALNFVQAIANGETLNAGTIVLSYDPQDKNGKKIEIVDGQQRLYTLLLFYKAVAPQTEDYTDSFLGKLEEEEEEEEERQLDLPSKLQLLENFRTIYESFNSSASNNSDVLSRLEKLEVTLYFLINKTTTSDEVSPALSYYVESNTSGVDLTPGQLLKAFHYSKIGKDLTNSKQDIRYLLEAWRLGYLSHSYKAFTPITFNEEKLKEFMSFLQTSEKTENGGYKDADRDFILSPLGDRSFSVETFIGNNDWNHAFYDFEGFLNTFQLILYGGRFPKETSLAVPALHDLQRYPGGLRRLQTSFEDKDLGNKTDERDLISRLLRIKPGLSFFQTTQDLLFDYSKLAEAIRISFSEDKDIKTKEPWIIKTVEAIEMFRKDWFDYQGLKDLSKFKQNIKDSGILLCIFCIALLYHRTFESTGNENLMSSVEDDGQSQNTEILKEIICSALWGGFSNGAYDTQCRGTGIFETGPIFLLSSSKKIAQDRLRQAVLYNNANLVTTLSTIKEDGRINRFESLNAFR